MPERVFTITTEPCLKSGCEKWVFKYFKPISQANKPIRLKFFPVEENIHPIFPYLIPT